MMLLYKVVFIALRQAIYSTIIKSEMLIKSFKKGKYETIVVPVIQKAFYILLIRGNDWKFIFWKDCDIILPTFYSPRRITWNFY